MSPLLELELLRAFVTVVERSGVSRAAAALHRTQSAVSMQIQRLERLTGTRLFVRRGRVLQLTTEGQALIGYAHRMLSLGEEALGAVAKNEWRGTVRLGSLDDYATRVVPRVLSAFWNSHPGVQIEVCTGLTTPLLERLGSDLDLVLGMQPAGTARGTVIYRDRPVWAASVTHEAHKSCPVPLALYPDGCLFRRWGTQALEDSGKAWRCAYVSPSFWALEAAVRAGLAVSIFKRSTLSPDLRRLTPAQGFPTLPEIEIVMHRAQGASRAADQLAEAVIEVLRSDTAKLARLAPA